MRYTDLTPFLSPDLDPDDNDDDLANMQYQQILNQLKNPNLNPIERKKLENLQMEHYLRIEKQFSKRFSKSLSISIIYLLYSSI